MSKKIVKSVKIIDIKIPDWLENTSWVKILILGIIVLGSGAGMVALFLNIYSLENKQLLAAEDARPARVKIVKITVDDCPNCYDVDSVIADLGNKNINIIDVRNVSFGSEEAQQLIAKYNIKKLPTYLAFGEISKNKSLQIDLDSSGDYIADAYLFTKVTPNYYDIETSRIRGQIKVTYLTDKECKVCTDPAQLITEYKKNGINILQEKSIDWKSKEGQALIKKYSIKKIPTLIMDSEATVYESINKIWENAGLIVEGQYILTNVSLPYRQTDNQKIIGLVDITSIVDDSCAECFDIKALLNVFTGQYRMSIVKQKTVLSSSVEGKRLIKQYKIKNLPTVLLSPEMKGYQALYQSWVSVGTEEADGWFVFRQPTKLDENIVYRDLVTNKIIKGVTKK